MNALGAPITSFNSVQAGESASHLQGPCCGIPRYIGTERGVVPGLVDMPQRCSGCRARTTTRHLAIYFGPPNRYIMTNFDLAEGTATKSFLQRPLMELLANSLTQYLLSVRRS